MITVKNEMFYLRKGVITAFKDIFYITKGDERSNLSLHSVLLKKN